MLFHSVLSILAVCWLVVAIAEAAGSLPRFSTSPSAPYFLDASNRPTFFHGTNFVQKGTPWYPPNLLNETNIALLAKMGMNTVRLGFMWTGAEPEKGVFNMTYFDTTASIIQTLAKYNIYAFLDIHQDVMSSYFCLYDAFPTWAVDESEQSKHAFPWPLQADTTGNVCPASRGWGANYLSEACGTAFQTLYTENSMMQYDFIAFWQKTASYFKELPILGYEIINEPWAGNIYHDLGLLLPGNAGRKNLMPFYDIISKAIREIDGDRVILYEPVTWGMILNGQVSGSGFDHVPGGDNFKDKSVFSFHYYCWWYSSDDMARKTCDQIFGPKVFEQAARDVKTTGGAAMLTEWGQGCNFDADLPTDINSECNQIMDLADKHFMSWTDWYFGEHLNGRFEISDNAMQIFSRTYARSIAGIPQQMFYNVTDKSFKLCFQPGMDGSISSMESELFVPFEVQYPQGIHLDLTTNLKLVSMDQKTGKVVLQNREIENKMELPSRACATITAK